MGRQERELNEEAETETLAYTQPLAKGSRKFHQPFKEQERKTVPSSPEGNKNLPKTEYSSHLLQVDLECTTISCKDLYALK